MRECFVRFAFRACIVMRYRGTLEPWPFSFAANLENKEDRSIYIYIYICDGWTYCKAHHDFVFCNGDRYGAKRRRIHLHLRVCRNRAGISERAAGLQNSQRCLGGETYWLLISRFQDRNASTR